MTTTVANSENGTDATDVFVEAFADFESKSQELGPEVHLLWTDAISFHNGALQAAQLGKTEEQERYLRAAVLVAAAAFEGFTNFFARSVIYDGLQMKEIERNALSEESERIDERGEIKSTKTKIGSAARFLLLYRLCSKGKQLDEKTKAKLESAFKVRDALVHPKPGCQVSLSVENRGTKAFLDFMTADMMLTQEAKANATPRSLFSRIGSSVQR